MFNRECNMAVRCPTQEQEGAGRKRIFILSSAHLHTGPYVAYNNMDVKFSQRLKESVALH
jgi:hypothetical protein